MIRYLLLFLILAAFSYVFVGALRRWAEKYQLLDVPNPRSSHVKPVARGGGIAIVLMTLIGLVLFGPSDRDFAATFLGAVLVAGLSWWDDVRSLPSWIRLIVHSVSALLAMSAVGWWDRIVLAGTDSIHLGWVGIFVTLLWIVGLTNAYNFMDGIDGIAGVQGLMAAAGWIILGSLADLPVAKLLGFLIASSTLGFLAHNWAPARIFMGDVGSAFLGYWFAVLGVAAAQTTPRLAVCGILLVWPFLFDTSFTFLKRLRRGERIFTAHRSHLYQRLVIAGFSHQTVSVIYGFLAATGVAAAVAIFLGTGEVLAVVTIALAAVALWLGVLFRERSVAFHRSPGPVL